MNELFFINKSKKYIRKRLYSQNDLYKKQEIDKQNN